MTCIILEEQITDKIRFFGGRPMRRLTLRGIDEWANQRFNYYVAPDVAGMEPGKQIELRPDRLYVGGDGDPLIIGELTPWPNGSSWRA